MRYPNARIIVFAKAPVVGAVKSRLAASIGPERAAQIYSEILQHTVEEVAAAGLAPVTLAITPDTTHPLFSRLQERFDLELEQQDGDDLGRRMYNSISSALEDADMVLLLGSDCPLLDRGYLQAAFARLDGGADVVLGPVEDGGYLLIGMRRPEPLLFSDIEWGGPEVMATTRERCSEAGLTMQELERRYDIDTYDDLRRWQQEVPEDIKI